MQMWMVTLTSVNIFRCRAICCAETGNTVITVRMRDMKHKSANNFLLVLTAFIWGSAFVAQSVGMDYLGPFTFNSVRCLMGGIVLLPAVFIARRKNLRNGKVQSGKTTVRKDGGKLLTGGICCGLALAAASSLQQVGLVYTTAGKAGFITALYILIVPVIRVFFGEKAGGKVWAGVALALAGMYFLCVGDGFTIAPGDLFVLLCAVIFSVHILVIDHYAPETDGISLSCIQFFVSGILCAVPMILYEKPELGALTAAWLPLAYAGVLSCGVAYTLQIVAQKNTDPTVASLVLSLESVFSAVTGWIVLGERLSGKELFGCLLVFSAVILAQLPAGEKSGRAAE